MFDLRGSLTCLDGVDFASLKSVARFAKALNAENAAFDVIVHNAGMSHVIGGEATVDGIETVYQVNHLAPYALTKWLLPALRRSASADRRVVFVASIAHYGGTVNEETYNAQTKGLGVFRRPLGRYDDSKLLNIIAAKIFAREHTDITFNAVHPGFVQSELDSQTGWPVNVIMPKIRAAVARDTAEGAVAQITLAIHPGMKGVTGRYFEDRCIETLCRAPCLFCDDKDPPGVVPHKEALDDKKREFVKRESDVLVDPFWV